MTKVQATICAMVCFCSAGVLGYSYFSVLNSRGHVGNEYILQAVLCLLIPMIVCAGAGIFFLAGNKNR